uniref:(California timema) hypothetical protein n=1 Tax=Timema californicum TaxID=61474 RepID=A0A7R9IXU5_TIMCA|nr:unnamed protein product [Timema californicum]
MATSQRTPSTCVNSLHFPIKDGVTKTITVELATKLLRLVAEQKQGLKDVESRRTLELENAFCEQRNRIVELETNNNILEDRVNVLKRQLTEFSNVRALIPAGFRSPSRRIRRGPDSNRSVNPSESNIGQENTDLMRLQAQVAILEQRGNNGRERGVGATMCLEHTITCSKSPDARKRTVLRVGRVRPIEHMLGDEPRTSLQSNVRQCRDVLWSYSLLLRQVNWGHNAVVCGGAGTTLNRDAALHNLNSTLVAPKGHLAVVGGGAGTTLNRDAALHNLNSTLVAPKGHVAVVGGGAGTTLNRDAALHNLSSTLVAPKGHIAGHPCYILRIQDLEAQREQGNTRIAQLEEELVEDQRKKVRENVELIRLNRSLALQAVQVAALEAEKQTLERDREQLQEALRQAVTENELIRVQLIDTKNQLTSLGVELQDSHEQQQRSRDLEDELKESQQEKEILKEYNSRLLSLSHAENSQEQLQNQKYEDLQERLSEMQLKLDTLSDSRAVIADQDMRSSPRQQSSPAKEPSLFSQVTLFIILIVTTCFIDHMLQGATLAVDKTANVGKMKATHLQSKLEQELSEKTKLMQLLEQLQNHQQEERPTENSAQEKLIREQVRILEDSLKREREERESLGKKMELEKQEVFNLRQEHHQMLEKLHTLESIMGNTNTMHDVVCNDGVNNSLVKRESFGHSSRSRVV